jgi:hypothetical protein
MPKDLFFPSLIHSWHGALASSQTRLKKSYSQLTPASAALLPAATILDLILGSLREAFSKF